MSHYIIEIFIKRRKSLAAQLCRYTVVGTVAAAVDCIVYHIAAVNIGINPLISNTISFVFGVLINYFLSREWVFSRRTNNFRRDFLLFLITGVIGLVIGDVFLYILLHFRLLYIVFLNLEDQYILDIAKVVTVIVVFSWNFMSRKTLVFSDTKE